jgi:hypothetical protein
MNSPPPPVRGTGKETYGPSMASQPKGGPLFSRARFPWVPVTVKVKPDRRPANSPDARLPDKVQVAMVKFYLGSWGLAFYYRDWYYNPRSLFYFIRFWDSGFE